MIHYELLQAPYPEPLFGELHAVGSAAFGEHDHAEVAWRLTHMPCSSVFVARAEQLVAFKLGYAVGRRRYHSWLGAVHPAWRRQGIAFTLLERQHRWLLEQGYGSVETAAVPGNVAMLSLNLRAGFRIIGTYCREGSEPRVTLAKALSS